MNHIISNVLRTIRRLPIRDPFNSWGPGPWIANLTKENRPSTTLWTMRRSSLMLCSPQTTTKCQQNMAQHGITLEGSVQKWPVTSTQTWSPHKFATRAMLSNCSTKSPEQRRFYTSVFPHGPALRKAPYARHVLVPDGTRMEMWPTKTDLSIWQNTV